MVNDSSDDSNFSNDYSDDSFWTKVKKFALVAGKQVIEKALTLYACMKDKETPKWAKGVIATSLAYFISPMDAIPDVTPFVGYADDLGVLGAALTMVAIHIKPEHVDWAKQKLQQWFGKGNLRNDAKSESSPNVVDLHQTPLPGGLIRCHTNDASLKEMHGVMKEWRSRNPKATRLDGWTNSKPHGKSWVVFPYSNQNYHLNADTTVAAIDRFIRLFEDNEGEPNQIFSTKCKKLVFANAENTGWFCYEGGARGTVSMAILRDPPS